MLVVLLMKYNSSIWRIHKYIIKQVICKETLLHTSKGIYLFVVDRAGLRVISALIQLIKRPHLMKQFVQWS